MIMKKQHKVTHESISKLPTYAIMKCNIKVILNVHIITHLPFIQ
jgi:hypothetical protein